ncbi:MAG: MaoC family dehydratase [Desulfarculaceae bacterium]|jgi:acyl dehydratase
MNQMRQRAIEGIKAGDVFEFSRTFSQEETNLFGDLTRDYNPVHYDPSFAQTKGFDGLICHGLLTGSMICQVGGQLGWLATDMSFKFLRPVYFGDTVTCRLKITALDPQGKAQARARMTNQQGQVVVEANLGGFLPQARDQEILKAMVSQGDPTNKLG